MAVNQSNLPSIQRLKFEDYARQTDWKQAFEALVASLNLFMTPTYNILNGGIGYMNLQIPQIYQTVITAAATTTFSFVNPLSIQPKAVLLGNCWTGLQSTHPAVALQVYWHYTGNTIQIDNIVGLTAGTQYNLTLVVF